MANSNDGKKKVSFDDIPESAFDMIKSFDVYGKPQAPLSVESQEKLISLLDEEISGWGTDGSDSSRQYELGFLSAASLVKMFLVTGGGKKFEKVMAKLDEALAEIVELSKPSGEA